MDVPRFTWLALGLVRKPIRKKCEKCDKMVSQREKFAAQLLFGRCCSNIIASIVPRSLVFVQSLTERSVEKPMKCQRYTQIVKECEICDRTIR